MFDNPEELYEEIADMLSDDVPYRRRKDVSIPEFHDLSPMIQICNILREQLEHSQKYSRDIDDTITDFLTEVQNRGFEFHQNYSTKQ